MKEDSSSHNRYYQQPRYHRNERIINKKEESSIRSILLLITLTLSITLVYHFLIQPINININQYSINLFPANRASESLIELDSNSNHDYNQYVWHKRILTDWNPESSDHRLIAIGDLHGMLDQLKELVQQLDYNPQSDTILLLGDLAAKHPSIQASLDTIRFCRESQLEAVRGNHDQYIIVWRNWMEAHRKSFVDPDQIQRYESDPQATLESDQWLQSDEPSQELKDKLPDGMKWRTQHFEIARRLPKIDLQWMINRTLTIYIPPIKTYFVHAGMLAWDPPNQLSSSSSLWSAKSKNETSPLLLLKENKDPFTLLEMRGLKKGRKPTKDAAKGKPWFKYWNRAMNTCDQDSALDREWCLEPYNVVYGHWAGKGLTIKPWSTGLDSGCVYGRQLSALVIGEKYPPVSAFKKKHKHHHHHHKRIPLKIHNQNATIVQISCPEP